MENLVIKTIAAFKTFLPLKYNEAYVIYLPPQLKLAEIYDIINIIRDVYPSEVLFQCTRTCLKIYHLSYETYNQLILKNKEELISQVKKQETTTSGLVLKKSFELMIQEFDTLPKYQYRN